MNAIKGIYHNGVIELIENPGIKGTAEVLVVFPEKKKKIVKIGGLFKGHKIDFAGIELELKKLSKHSQQHMLDEAADQTHE